MDNLPAKIVQPVTLDQIKNPAIRSLAQDRIDRHKQDIAKLDDIDIQYEKIERVWRLYNKLPRFLIALTIRFAENRYRHEKRSLAESYDRRLRFHESAIDRTIKKAHEIDANPDTPQILASDPRFFDQIL